MKKSDSETWKLALKFSRRKGVNWKPVLLAPDGLSVNVVSLIRGNAWKITLDELRAKK